MSDFPWYMNLFNTKLLEKKQKKIKEEARKNGKSLLEYHDSKLIKPYELDEVIEILENTSVTPNIHPDEQWKWDNAMEMAIETLRELRKLKPMLYQKHGEWIEHRGEIKPFECSRCHFHQKYFSDYCPFCGSKNFI